MATFEIFMVLQISFDDNVIYYSTAGNVKHFYI